MKQEAYVINSNAINRYGYRFSVGALVSAQHDNVISGIPRLVAHDFSRLIGWTQPVSVHIEPGIARLLAVTYTPEDSEDNQLLAQHFRAFLYNMHVEETKEEVTLLRQLLAPYLQQNGDSIAAECIALVESDLARRAFPEIFDLADKDGLIPLCELVPLGPGIFKVDNLALFCHPFFRRNLFRLNTLNNAFLRELQGLPLDAFQVSVALDPDMVGLASSYTGGREELAYWWGPKFDNDLSSIRTGVCHHEASEVERICFGISATQFRWGSQKGKHIFEAEELRDLPSAADPTAKYGCRYVHSIIAENTGQIEHFDGSIRTYSEEEMIERLGLTLANASRSTEYTKLWRVDGDIGISRWKTLLSDYFRDNFLVGEYLGAVRDASLQPVSPDSHQALSLHSQYVPFSMTQGDGPRVAISFHAYEATVNEDREIVSFDFMSDGRTTTRYVENDGFELIKAMRKAGLRIHIPDDIQLVSFRDFYLNLPLVRHSRLNAQASLEETMRSIYTVLTRWRETGRPWIVTCAIGFPLTDEEKEVRISFMGPATNLLEWLSHPLAYPPNTLEGLRDWADKVSAHLDSTFRAAGDCPPAISTLMPSGLFRIDRRRVEWGGFTIHFLEEPEALCWELRVPKEKKELVLALSDAGISPGLGYHILKSRCSSCKSEYRDCSCSKLLDDAVSEEIVSAVPFLFWTDRSM